MGSLKRRDDDDDLEMDGRCLVSAIKQVLIMGCMNVCIFRRFPCERARVGEDRTFQNIKFGQCGWT